MTSFNTSAILLNPEDRPHVFQTALKTVVDRTKRDPYPQLLDVVSLLQAARALVTPQQTV
jgi:hypothetical protein